MGLTLQANAASNSVGSLYGCTVTIGCHSDGVSVTLETHATEKADEIGCKDIVLVEKDGSSIKEINIPNGSVSDSNTYIESYTYKGAVKGRTYYAYCTHYAAFGDKTKTVKNSTDEMVYN